MSTLEILRYWWTRKLLHWAVTTLPQGEPRKELAERINTWTPIVRSLLDKHYG